LNEEIKEGILGCDRHLKSAFLLKLLEVDKTTCVWN